MTTSKLLLSTLALVTLAVAQEDVLVTLPDLGVIQGQTRWTIGNLGHESKMFYNFRNIPFAESVAGPRRFSQPVQLRTPIGTVDSPYDARHDGPLCPQLGLSQETLDDLNSRLMDDIILTILTTNNLEGLISVDTVLTIMEHMFETPMKGVTFGDVFYALLDIDLSVNEDCLHLAVSTPRLPSTEKQAELLPVMFFIYGGGFVAGTQMKMGYERLGDVNDVVLVAVNYRLGSFGFMCLDSDEAGGNMGILDQIVGLEWVQENIAYFGGDPSRVTIFGESAGAASVGMLTLSPLTRGLFSQAIGQSGAANAPWGFSDVNTAMHARNMAAKVGCTEEDSDLLVECLRTKDYNSIVQADLEYAGEQMATGTSLGFDGHSPCGQTHGTRKVMEFGERPIDLLQSGNYNPVPMFFGANLDEGLLPFSMVDAVLNETVKNDADFLINEAVKLIHSLAGFPIDQETADGIRDDYFSQEQQGNYLAMVPGMVDMTGALFMKDPPYQVIENNYRFADSFFYSLEKRSQKSFHRIFDQLGNPDLTPVENLDTFCMHADDLIHLFNVDLPVVLCDLGRFFTGLTNAYLRCVVLVGADDAEECVTGPNSQFREDFGECLDSHLLDSEKPASDAMVQAFSNFAIHGTPTPVGSTLPNLEPWSPAVPNYIVINTETTVALDYRLSYHSTPQRKIKIKSGSFK